MKTWAASHSAQCLLELESKKLQYEFGRLCFSANVRLVNTNRVVLVPSLNEDDMTSIRGQNVSVLQLRGTQPLELPSTARRAAPISSFKIGSNEFTNGKGLNQISLGNYLSEAYNPSRNSNTCVLSSETSCGVSRELSPVYWCDRDVDEVYLGKSGWVQVQQKSLDDSRGTPREQSSTASTLHSKKFSSSINSNVNSLGRREQNRPVNLPLSSRRRSNLANHKTPYAFTQELVTVPPLSVTPILSPPPAFRDEIPFDFEDSLLWRSRAVVNSESSSGATSPTAEASGSTLSPSSASKHHSLQGLQTKSLDEELLERTSHDEGSLSTAPFTLFASRSLNNNYRKTNSVNGGNSTFKSVHTSEGKAKIPDQEDYEDSEDDQENCSSRHSVAFQTSSREGLNPQRDVSSTRRQRRFQFNGKRTSMNNSISVSRTRSPSLDSNSSSGSSADGKSLKTSSRRFTAKQFQPRSDHFTGDVSKYYGVKRSRSLQLSEERSPHEPMSMSHSSSGKSWDQVSSECATFPDKIEYNRHHSQSFRNLQNVMVAVNGQGIPVISPGGQSPNLLNEITTSEEEQLKLIREAAKEAKVISEFLSGTKSRAAARSLLMHRYFNRPVPGASDYNGGDAPSKHQSDSRFLRSQQPIKYASIPRNHTHFHPSSHDTQRHADHTKSLAPSTRPSNCPTPLQTLNLLHDYSHPISNHTDSPQVIATRSKRTHQQQPFFLTSSIPNNEKPPPSTTTQRQGSHTTKHRSTRKFQSFPTGITVTAYFENVTETPLTLDTPIDSRRRRSPLDAFRQNSSTSSSSIDASQQHLYGLPANTPKVSTTSDLSLDSLCLHSESFTLNNSPVRRLCHSRPASAPETKHYTSLPAYQRSLSLPRSFLSEHYAPQYFARRNSFPWRRQQWQTVDVHAGECLVKSTASATFPIMTARHSKDNRNTKTTICDKSPGSHRKRKHRNRASTYEDGDGHDSGSTQGEICRKIDSAESQDDGPLPGGSHRGIKTCGSDGRDVRDLPRPVSHSSSLRSSQTISSEPLIQDSASLDRLPRGQLRRSFSLNELFPEATQSFSRFPCRALSEDENPFEGNSEDELSSDSESSERNHSIPSAQKEEPAAFAEAVWDHIASEPFELSFRAGDVIEVLDKSDRHWWWGVTAQNYGYFPSAFVRLRMSPPDTVVPVAYQASSNLRRNKSSPLSSEQVRSNVVRELLNTERDFVKILRGVKDGYMAQCGRRPDMFTSAQISTIFGNLDDILVFQEEFLKDLEGRIDEEFPHRSCVGEVFLNHSSGFRMYSEYCNFHPMAMAVLQELYRKDKYCKFFEMCRLQQNLSEIPLDGYLLTPVQRICKYPLQLAELLKYTKPDHPDFGKVEKALETMRSVAMLINERKRKMERLEKLAAWQRRVEGWEGDDLIELSSQLIYQGDVVRITSGMWTTNITLFLFDHQMIYCKKDLLKRHNYIYKGRICLDGSEVIDLADGKNQQLGATIRYGIRICSNSKEKWLVFCCRSSEDKEKWLSALAEEKRVVAYDKEVDLDLPPTAKQLATMGAMETKKIISNKPRGKNKIRSSREEMSGVRDGRLNTVKVKGGRRMGMWFTFGGVMKSPKVSLRQRTSFQQQIT